MRTTRWTNVFLVTVLALAVGCGEDATPTASGDSGDSLPANLMLATAPGDARPLSDVKASAKPGDEVVLLAVIGGRKEPIAGNRAILTVVDPSIETCDKLPGDSCPTPWDACCVPQEDLTAGSATVQVAAPDGRPLRVGLADFGGIRPLKQVIVVGTVAPSSDEKNLVINASGIHVLN